MTRNSCIPARSFGRSQKTLAVMATALLYLLDAQIEAPICFFPSPPWPARRNPQHLDSRTSGGHEPRPYSREQYSFPLPPTPTIEARSNNILSSRDLKPLHAANTPSYFYFEQAQAANLKWLMNKRYCLLFVYPFNILPAL
jgi:hypothetical protein